MNKSEYMSKAEELLSDTNTYKVEKKNPTTSCTKKLNVILKDLKEQGAIEQNTYRHLSPTSQECPKFYGLPKIHKASVPLRPIVSCRGTPIYNTAKFVARIIKPLVGKSSHHVENSQDLIKKLKGMTVEDNEIMASFDVTALFTNVPIRESLDIIEQRLKEDETLKDRTILSVSQIIKLLECCLTTTYFLFNGKFYTQTEGSAMGSPVSPLVANLFMEHFEVKAIQSFNHVVKFWARYVDDTFCIIHQDKLEEFTNHLNSQHDKIKFTIEKEEDNSLPMLDVKVKRNTNGQLSFSVYRKATHTDHYLQFSSHQPLEHKIGVVRTLQHRARHHITTVEDLMEENKHIKKVLAISEYPSWLWDMPAANRRKDNTTMERPSRPLGHVTLPYIQGTSEALARKMRQAGVMVHSRPHTKLRELLVKPKDKSEDMEKADVVYKIQCKDCDSNYVGETSRLLKTRVKEHQRPSSPVCEHAQTTGHQIDYQKPKVLDRESDWFRRGVKEAIHIEANRSDLNRDRGRHHLSAVYRQLVNSQGPGPTSGESHQGPSGEAPGIPL